MARGQRVLLRRRPPGHGQRHGGLRGHVQGGVGRARRPDQKGVRQPRDRRDGAEDHRSPEQRDAHAAALPRGHDAGDVRRQATQGPQRSHGPDNHHRHPPQKCEAGGANGDHRGRRGGGKVLPRVRHRQLCGDRERRLREVEGVPPRLPRRGGRRQVPNPRWHGQGPGLRGGPAARQEPLAHVPRLRLGGGRADLRARGGGADHRHQDLGRQHVRGRRGVLRRPLRPHRLLRHHGQVGAGQARRQPHRQGGADGDREGDHHR
mmetsp:Transcript_92041/g.257252  ORF Transcript_92041/g.257252 Transcript_92041/m.257252 type:complete len:262 (+) Transcript_92041:329-1114(+)